MSGTSYATPTVSGLAGFLLSHNPDLTGPQLYDIITNTNINSSWQYDDSVNPEIAPDSRFDIGRVQFEFMIVGVATPGWNCPSPDDIGGGDRCECWCNNGAYVGDNNQQGWWGPGDCDSDGDCEEGCRSWCVTMTKTRSSHWRPRPGGINFFEAMCYLYECYPPEWTGPWEHPWDPMLALEEETWNAYMTTVGLPEECFTAGYTRRCSADDISRTNKGGKKIKATPVK